ncbi:rolling circle replication-associated protein [Anaerovorax sp. IOR16]|uniref:rolling circle replication-associated protein n=1 Tax=Anaerovorax sp. IOR16 TaxID=2773458 RepID=UPI0019D2A94C|nr:hypothetical protein [Anaerovorax sp. IOR16]
MGVMRYLTVAGNTIFVKVSGKRAKRAPGETRSERKNPTTEEVEKLNEKYAAQKLGIIINHNFKNGDLHIVLTYAGKEPSKEDAKKHLEKFKRDLAKLYKKYGIILKWVTATEYENKRIHHHMVCTGGVEIFEIAKLWKYGFIRPTYLDDTGDYRKLANYLIKETSKTFRKTDAVSKRRYNCSRSIERPITNKEEVSGRMLWNDPSPLKGYYIDQDSIYRGEQIFTGRPYLEYVMVSMEEEPRIKKWGRGKKIKQGICFDGWLRKNREKQIEIPINESDYLCC